MRNMVVLIEYKDAGGDLFGDGKIMRCSNDGLSRLPLAKDELHQPALAARVQPVVGSSNSHTSGERLSTEASATRFFSPLESWCGGRSRNFSICKAARAAATRSFTSSWLTPNCSGAKATSSHTDGMNSCTSLSWNTRPTRRRKSKLKASSRKAASVSGFPEGQHGTPIGEIQPVQDLQQRALPAAIRTQDDQALPRCDCQVDLVQGGDFLIVGKTQVRYTKYQLVFHE